MEGANEEELKYYDPISQDFLGQYRRHDNQIGGHGYHGYHDNQKTNLATGYVEDTHGLSYSPDNKHTDYYPEYQGHQVLSCESVMGSNTDGQKMQNPGATGGNVGTGSQTNPDLLQTWPPKVAGKTNSELPTTDNLDNYRVSYKGRENGLKMSESQETPSSLQLANVPQKDDKTYQNMQEEFLHQSEYLKCKYI